MHNQACWGLAPGRKRRHHARTRRCGRWANRVIAPHVQGLVFVLGGSGGHSTSHLCWTSRVGGGFGRLRPNAGRKRLVKGMIRSLRGCNNQEGEGWVSCHTYAPSGKGSLGLPLGWIAATPNGDRLAKCGALSVGYRVNCGVSHTCVELEAATHQPPARAVESADGRCLGGRNGPHAP